MATRWTDNAYFVPNFQVVSKGCKTNTPSTTSMRAPGVLHAVMAIEHAIEAGVCPAVGMDRAVRAKNFYRVGDAAHGAETQVRVFAQVLGAGAVRDGRHAGSSG